MIVPDVLTLEPEKKLKKSPKFFPLASALVKVLLSLLAVFDEELPTEFVAKLGKKHVEDSKQILEYLRAVLKCRAEPLFEEARELRQETVASLSRLTISAQWLKMEFREWISVLVSESKIIFCTVNSVARKSLTPILSAFPVIIADEGMPHLIFNLMFTRTCTHNQIASQLLEYDTAILYHKGLRNLILVGDENQLAPTVFSQQVVSAGFGQSLFSRLITQLRYPTQTLSVQYRMHPDISMFPNTEFYRGRIADGSNVLQHHKSWYSNSFLVH
jgi:hypothetical protein